MTHTHDPKKIGPGSWVTLHIASAKPDSQFFLMFCKFLSDEFPCLTCRSAIREYMQLDSPFELKEEIDDNGRDISRAKWSWIFHNSVNQKLNKDLFAWDSFERIYYIDTVCNLDCGDDTEKKENKKTKVFKGIT
jgi:hypothetical protein